MWRRRRSGAMCAGKFMVDKDDGRCALQKMDFLRR